MPSLLKASTTGKPLFTWLVDFLLIFLSVSSSCVHGASLREHRLRGSEPDPQRENLQQGSSVDMLKALEYIDSLRQRTGTDSQKQTGYHTAHLDDTQQQRDMPRLDPNANPMQGQGPVQPDEEDEEEEQEGRENTKTEELLQAVLSTLQQSEQASKPAPLRSGGREAEGAGIREDPWEQQKQRAIMLHKKMPLMFEDDEEGEGDEEEENEEGPDLERGSPLKRTNENVEEKYTPQNLATLQSVFEELGKLTDTKATQKRQDEEDYVEEGDDMDDGDDLFNVRNVAYDDEAGDLTDWAPLQDLEDEDEEEEEGNNEENERGLDHGNDEDDDNDAFEEEDNESYPVKRSSNSSPQRDPEDIANLVDYYFLKVLEKTEEEHKRELEEEEERREERRAAQYRDSIDPRLIYQLIQISQQFQIPPEDLLDMLKTGELTNQGRATQSQRINAFTRVENKPARVSLKKTHKSPAQVYNTPERQSSNTPENLRTEEILKILGLGSLENPDQAPGFRRLKQYKSSQSRLHTQPARESAPVQRLLTGKLKDDYEDGVDEDELAAYLAAQMLAQYPQRPYKSKAGPKRDVADQATPAGSFEQAMQDYFDQMDSETNQKRQTDQSDGLENEAVMKLLSYMNPESPGNDDDDDKSVPGM
ncbi:secretogranin-2a [Genypterus blacodes]|uniref:secretogranin-2a n=1 Tax=Genypterus blacodes TaxID=154954 RepID=UPI003F75B096